MTDAQKRTLTVWDSPVPKPRPRVLRTGHAYTPAHALEAERRIRQAWIDRFGEPRPTAGPVMLSVTAWMPMPASIPLKRRATAQPTKRPDADNLGKTVLDALNKVAFVDDSQVVDLHVRKVYGFGPDATPRWTISVVTLADLESGGDMEEEV